MLQVELQNEIESSTEMSNLNSESQKSSLYKQKCKIWLDIGNLFLFKFSDPHEAFKYFEMVLKTALDTNDLLLNSLTLGNLGLCKQKNGEYETALDYFKEQLIVLDKKLKSLDEASVLNDLNKKPQHSINIQKLINDDFSTESSNLSNNSNNFGPLTFQLTQQPNECVSSSNQVILNYENIMKIKEIISIRIDMGRSYAKLGKCYELLSQQKLGESQYFLREALKYYNNYCIECFYLFENYAKSYFTKLEEKKLLDKFKKSFKKTKKKSSDDHEENFSEKYEKRGEDMFEEINLLMKDLSEQIYTDYDTSLAKLASFYFTFDVSIKNVNNLEKSIELNEKRLNLLNFSSKYILNKSYCLNLCIQINFMLANFYAKQVNTLPKSKQYCENIIELYSNEISSSDSKSKKNNTSPSKFKEDIFLIETLNLLCDVSVTFDKSNLDSNRILNNAIRSYNLVWQYMKLNDSKILQLKYDTMCRLCAIYRLSKMTKESLEVLMDSLQRFMLEFQQLQQQEQMKVTDTNPNKSKNDSDISESM
jgi:hypothetical protein